MPSTSSTEKDSERLDGVTTAAADEERTREGGDTVSVDLVVATGAAAVDVAVVVVVDADDDAVEVTVDELDAAAEVLAVLAEAMTAVVDGEREVPGLCGSFVAVVEVDGVAETKDLLLVPVGRGVAIEACDDCFFEVKLMTDGVAATWSLSSGLAGVAKAD